MKKVLYNFLKSLSKNFFIILVSAVLVSFGFVIMTWSSSGVTTIGTDISTTDLTVSGDSSLAALSLSGDLDFNLNEAKEMVLENLATYPASTTAGNIFWSTTTSSPYWYNGSDWKSDMSGATFVVSASDSKNKERADYFCDGTDDHLTIQTAIDALPSGGGKVLLLEGTYDINPGATEYAISIPTSTILSGVGYSTILRLNDDAVSNHYGMIGLNGVSNVIVENLTVDGNQDNQTDNGPNDDTYQNGIRSLDAPVENVTIRNCYVHDIMHVGIGFAGMYASGDDASYRHTNVKVINNRVVNARITGASLYYSLVSGNYIEGSDNSNAAIEIQFPFFTQIINNRIKDSANLGIKLDPQGHTTVLGTVVANNTIDTTNSTGIWLNNNFRSGIVANNVLYNIGTTGMQINSSTFMKITGNTFDSLQNNGLFALQLVNVDDSIVSNNIIQGPAEGDYDTDWKYGIKGLGISRCMISGNYIQANSQGIALTSSTVDGALSTYNKISDNKFDNVTNFSIKEDEDGAHDYNYIVNNDVEGAANQTIQTVGSNTVLDKNNGYSLVNSGAATVSAASTYVIVTHGIRITPATSSISVTPTNNLGDATGYHITEVNADNFKIDLNAAPGTGKEATFVWNVGSY